MKIITADKIRDAVKELCLRANFLLRPDVLSALKAAYAREDNKRAKNLLSVIIKNGRIARLKHLAICQDTGLPIVFMQIGQGALIRGNLNAAVNKGVEAGYKEGSFRGSIVKDPLNRGASSYQPGITHINVTSGNKIKITVLIKGFGSENKSQLKMFNPTADKKEIKKFIIDAVKNAGADACPPYIVGVGIGGSADYAAFLAKKALLSKIKDRLTPAGDHISALERGLLNDINKLNIGPMGLGGKTTCLGVNIITAPTHIAGLPVAVNISCHALRSATKIL
ncbi:MAG: fumarate hydratase [Candidatus Omnitrophica bacterium]|nr:fumarate hydratase [Candidatus Omnitrophota bacterium]MDD5654394.1 fumarate hydratase [Candidatus Omnitrophota bacterium]